MITMIVYASSGSQPVRVAKVRRVLRGGWQVECVAYSERMILRHGGERPEWTPTKERMRKAKTMTRAQALARDFVQSS